MTRKPPAVAGAEFLAAAVRQQMLTKACAADLAPVIKRSGQPAGEYLVDAGRLTPIQVEAIDGLLAPTSVAPGYEIVGLLGHGGIGIVYRARQPNLDREVALKTISTARVRESAAGKGSTAVARFQQEAKAIAKLKHPNIVTAYDYGAGDDRLYLAMEMVDGIDLETFINRHDRVDEATAWQLVRQTAAALSAALESGIVHRDIKPANLLLAEPPAGYPMPRGVPLLKVTDFGLARLSTTVPGQGDAEDATRLTMTGATMGTPHYMAPEQIDDAQVGHLADIYALGATAYHMIAGEPPLAGLSLIKIFTAKLSGEGASINDLPPDVSQPTRDLLAAMLAHEPSDRPQDYPALLGRVSEVLQDEASRSGIGLGTTLSMPDASLPGAAEDRSTSETVLIVPAGQAQSPRRWLAAAVAGALAAAGLAAWSAGLLATAPAGPPPRDFRAGAEAPPLYRPGNLLGWKKAPGTQQFVSIDYPSRFGLVASSAAEGRVSTSLAKGTQAFKNPGHYRVEFSVVLSESAWLEVDMGDTGDGPPVLRIEQGQATLGVRGPSGVFEPSGDGLAVGAGAAVGLTVERFNGVWVFSSADQVIGWAKAAEPPPNRLAFSAGKQPVFLGDLSLTELLPTAAEAAR
ncbi:MAG: serine/threonine-protein kinase [Planctomycetota bacterium]